MNWLTLWQAAMCHHNNGCSSWPPLLCHGPGTFTLILQHNFSQGLLTWNWIIDLLWVHFIWSEASSIKIRFQFAHPIFVSSLADKLQIVFFLSDVVFSKTNSKQRKNYRDKMDLKKSFSVVAEYRRGSVTCWNAEGQRCIFTLWLRQEGVRTNLNKSIIHPWAAFPQSPHPWNAQQMKKHPRGSKKQSHWSKVVPQG